LYRLTDSSIDKIEIILPTLGDWSLPTMITLNGIAINGNLISFDLTKVFM